MPWTKVDDAILDHPKLLDVPPASRWLFIAAIVYCRRNHTAGLLTRAQAASLLAAQGLTKKHVGELVRVGLLIDVDCGFRVHDYEEFQPLTSTERVRKHRTVKRDETLQTVPGTPLARASAPGSPQPQPVPVPERDLTSPPNPPPYQVDDMLGEFLRVVSEGLARALRPDEIDRLSSWWDQMPRLRPDLARAQIEDYLTWRRTNLPAKEVPLKGVDLLHDQLRQLDGRLADDGYPTRERRRASIQIDGMTPVSELVADVLGPTLRAKP